MGASHGGLLNVSAASTDKPLTRAEIKAIESTVPTVPVDEEKLWPQIKAPKLPSSRAAARRHETAGGLHGIFEIAISKEAERLKTSLCYGKIKAIRTEHATRGEKVSRLQYDLTMSDETRKLLTSPNCPFRYTYLHFSLPGHSNSAIVDHRLKTVEHFEPHGGETGLFASDKEDEKHKIAIDQAWKRLVSEELPGYRYIPFWEVCPGELGPQTSEYCESWKQLRKDFNVTGFCVAWSALYLHLRLLNPDIPAPVITKYMTYAGHSPAEMKQRRDKAMAGSDKDKQAFIDWICREKYTFITKYIVWAESHSPFLLKGVERDVPKTEEFGVTTSQRGEALPYTRPEHLPLYSLTTGKRRAHALPKPR